MKKIKLISLLESIIICFLAAGLGSIFTTPSINTWYAALKKPVFNPPNWVFGPVWTTLYLMMGISLYLVWTNNSDKKKLKYFFIQLALNALWSIVFFGLHSPLFAFGVIILLWIFIFLTIKNFLRVSKTAAYLLIPYIAWVSFAAILNLSVAILNI